MWRLAYGHQAGIATGGGGVDREGVLDEQALQRDVGLAAMQAVHTDDGAVTGCLARGGELAHLSQLIRVAVVQQGIEVRLPVAQSATSAMGSRTSVGREESRERVWASSGSSTWLPTARQAASWASRSAFSWARQSTRSRGSRL